MVVVQWFIFIISWRWLEFIRQRQVAQLEVNRAQQVGNQPNRFSSAQPMCAAAATTTTNDAPPNSPAAIMAAANARRRSWDAPITLQQHQQQRVRDQVWSSGITFLVRRLLLRCPRRRRSLIPCGGGIYGGVFAGGRRMEWIVAVQLQRRTVHATACAQYLSRAFTSSGLSPASVSKDGRTLHSSEL